MRSVAPGALGLILGAFLGFLTAETLLQILILMLVVGALFYFASWAVLESRRRREEPNRCRRETLQNLVPQMEELAGLMDGMPFGTGNPDAWVRVPAQKISRARHLIAELEYGFNSVGIGVPSRHYPEEPHYPQTNYWLGMLREITEPCRRGDLAMVEGWTAPLTEIWLERKDMYEWMETEEGPHPHILDERYGEGPRV